MSTKVYNGFALRGMSTKAALAILGAQRAAIQELVNLKHRKLLVERMTTYADTYTLARHLADKMPDKWDGKDTSSVWYSCVDELQAEQAKCRGTQLREPLIDCDVEVVLYMTTGGMVFGHLQEERVGVYDHLLSVEGIVDFGYWNSTDRPDDISAREWNRRGKVWHTAFDDKAGVPRFSMRWQPEYELPRELVYLLPSLEDRARARALATVQNEILQKEWPLDRRNEFHIAMRLLRHIEKAMEDPESDIFKQVAMHAADYGKLLVPDLEKHLLTKLSELPGLPPAKDAAAAEPAQSEPASNN